jgi:TolB-like protein/Tfp pilus assembly protein PilF
VLPFTNVSSALDTEYLSDGVTEGLIDNLSQLPHLTVMSRNSVFRYKMRDVDAQAAGRELKVQAVLTGRVIQRGDDLSVSVELVDVKNNTHIWGEVYKRKVNDLLALQNDITRDISQKLRQKLTGEQENRLARRATANPEVYQLYLKGRYFAQKFTREGVDKGIGYFHQAIDLDPNYALAYEGLAYAYWAEADLLVAPHEVMPKGQEAAKKALGIDDTLAEAHIDLALIYFGYHFDWGAAEKEFRRAIELRPTYPAAHAYYAWFLVSQGRADEATQEGNLALQLDPLSPEINYVVAQNLYVMGRVDPAIDQLGKTLDLDPNYVLAHTVLGMAYIQKRDFVRARAELQKNWQMEPKIFWSLAEMGRLAAVSGDRREAERVLGELGELSKSNYVAAYYSAIINAELGNKQQAIAGLETGYEDGSPFLTYVLLDPDLGRLRAEARLHELIRRMGLAQ